MKIIIIGASGIIGRGLVQALQNHHELIRVSRTTGDMQADLGDTATLARLFQACAPFDAVMCAAGDVAFGALEDDSFGFGIETKLLGQTQVVRQGLPHIRDGGSFTLTSGALAIHPMPQSATISMINAGVEAFVRAAALDLPRGVRINAVSPPWVCETLEAMGRDPAPGVPCAQVAAAFAKSLEGDMTGEVFRF